MHKITWEEEVYKEFMAQKDADATMLGLKRLTINDQMRRLLKQNSLEQAVRQAEGL